MSRFGKGILCEGKAAALSRQDAGRTLMVGKVSGHYGRCEASSCVVICAALGGRKPRAV